MNDRVFLLPVLVQVFLTFALLAALGLRRRTGKDPGPARDAPISRSFSNQFELPMLFYALIAFILITRQADWLLLILAWLFVVARIAHAGVHVTTNHGPTRFGVYAVGALALLVMWIIYAIKLIAILSLSPD
jgi:hypothetical protein